MMSLNEVNLGHVVIGFSWTTEGTSVTFEASSALHSTCL